MPSIAAELWGSGYSQGRGGSEPRFGLGLGRGLVHPHINPEGSLTEEGKSNEHSDSQDGDDAGEAEAHEQLLGC